MAQAAAQATAGTGEGGGRQGNPVVFVGLLPQHIFDLAHGSAADVFRDGFEITGKTADGPKMETENLPTYRFESGVRSSWNVESLPVKHFHLFVGPFGSRGRLSGPGRSV